MTIHSSRPSSLPALPSDSALLRVPAEWEPQSAIWLAWPHNRDTWPNHFDAIPKVFAQFARQIAESTPVRILASHDDGLRAEKLIGTNRNVTMVEIPTNDCWIRDFGPSFVRDVDSGRTHGVDWRFNAWGGKYPPWDDDDAAARKMCDWAGIACLADPLCVEGGALETDGLGRLLTTPDCVATDTRNPGITINEVSQRFHDRLGITEIVWLDGGGLEGDDTDGHIDQLARFVDTRNVVVAVCDDPDDPNHEPLESNYRQLKLWGSNTSPSVQIHRLPIPPRRSVGGQRVPESYCNFLMLGTSRILVPTFGSPDRDDFAIGKIRELRTGAEVVPIDCRDLIWGLGALHCASRDQPA